MPHFILSTTSIGYKWPNAPMQGIAMRYKGVPGCNHNLVNINKGLAGAIKPIVIRNNKLALHSRLTVRCTIHRPDPVNSLRGGQHITRPLAVHFTRNNTLPGVNTCNAATGQMPYTAIEPLVA